VYIVHLGSPRPLHRSVNKRPSLATAEISSSKNSNVVSLTLLTLDISSRRSPFEQNSILNLRHYSPPYLRWFSRITVYMLLELMCDRRASIFNVTPSNSVIKRPINFPYDIVVESEIIPSRAATGILARGRLSIFRDHLIIALLYSVARD